MHTRTRAHARRYIYLYLHVLNRHPARHVPPVFVSTYLRKKKSKIEHQMYIDKMGFIRLIFRMNQ